MPKRPKHPHPDEMGNGEFSTAGGLKTYEVLYDLIGRVGRLEGGFVVIIALLAAILGLLGTLLVKG